MKLQMNYTGQKEMPAFHKMVEIKQGRTILGSNLGSNLPAGGGKSHPPVAEERELLLSI